MRCHEARCTDMSRMTSASGSDQSNATGRPAVSLRNRHSDRYDARDRRSPSVIAVSSGSSGRSAAHVPTPHTAWSFGRRAFPNAFHMGYHMVMARREVLVQLDDDLVEQLDELAAALGTNRSELMRRGAQAVLDAERLAAADQQLRAAYRRQPADPTLVQSARRLAAETAPAW